MQLCKNHTIIINMGVVIIKYGSTYVLNSRDWHEKHGILLLRTLITHLCSNLDITVQTGYKFNAKRM